MFRVMFWVRVALGLRNFQGSNFFRARPFLGFNTLNAR